VYLQPMEVRSEDGIVLDGGEVVILD